MERPLRQKFMDTVGFLKWARVHEDDVREFDFGDTVDASRVFVSPDVHSVHIVWLEDDGYLRHEIADYPYDDDVTVFDFLDAEVGDDSWDMFEPGDHDILEDLNDYGNEFASLDEVPVVTVKQLEAA